MSTSDSQEQYSPPSHELYGRDKHKRTLPPAAASTEATSPSQPPPLADQPFSRRSPSLLRASASLASFADSQDAPPTLLKRHTLHPKWRPRRLIGVTGLLVLVLSSSLLAWVLSQHYAQAATILTAQSVAATQTALDYSTRATQTAIVVAPLAAFTASIPGPCADAKHWSFVPGANNPNPPPCLANGVQLSASSTTLNTQTAPIVEFRFPGGALMQHYRVSLTFAALHTTPNVATTTPACASLELDFIPINANTDGLDMCQNGAWSHHDPLNNDNTNVQSGHCSVNADQGFSVQVQVNATAITYSCNTSPIAIYTHYGYSTDHIAFTLIPAVLQHTQSYTSTVTVSHFSYTPLP